MKNKWYGESFKLGVLGGGQLGRMLIQSAMNYDVHVYVMDSSITAPCGRLAYEFVEGNILSFDDVVAFGKDKDVVTVEIEHVNVDALEELEKQGVKVFPQPHILRLIQDKGLQKNFYKENNIPTAPFHLIDDQSEIAQYTDQLPFVQKMRKGGYDGKGVMTIKTIADFDQSFNGPSLIEKKINFKKELSVLVARNEHGEIKTFPVVECEFSKTLNLVEFLFSPANISAAIEKSATELAEKVITDLGLVGLLAVELFLTQEDELLVNEVAPRTHNSGHHTVECNFTSQFEQHLRSILGLPLGDTGIKRPGVMVNLLGEEGYTGPAVYDGIEKLMEMSEVYVHLYGKEETKPNRKMGHVTITNDDLNEAKRGARIVQESIKVIS
ncbi:5-(carboxyamino)imidazole ribonucleotide synthase [Brumimicrobium sp.]|uniref:5-(carboxyamino)imidazole ribonucleotide synthase n=1 Tax=Brumimicrobium sp. TaxID=2029867 RepID=UPI003A8D8713